MTTGGYPASAARVPKVARKRRGDSTTGAPVRSDRRSMVFWIRLRAYLMPSLPTWASSSNSYAGCAVAKIGRSSTGIPGKRSSRRRSSTSSPSKAASSSGMGRSRVRRSRVRFFKDGTRSRMVEVPRSGGRRSPQTSIETWPGRAPVALRVSRMAKSCLVTRPTRQASRVVRRMPCSSTSVNGPLVGWCVRTAAPLTLPGILTL